MASEATSPIVQAVTDRLWARDQRQMQVVDQLLSVVEAPARRPRTRPSKRRHSAPWAGFRSILCAIDFSEQSRLALRYAATLASRGRATLRVVYVNDPLLTAAASVALNDHELSARSAAELRAFVEASIPPGLRRRLHLICQVGIGNPSATILAAADKTTVDLIVVGTHGLRGVHRLNIGSTTRQLLRHTRIPILAIPRPKKRRNISPSPSWPGKRIVAAIELGRPGATEVNVAAHIARSFNSSLTAVHVVTKAIPPTWLRAMLGTHDRDQAARARQRLASLVNRTRSRAPIDVRVISGGVADALVSFVVKERAALVVVALQGSRRSIIDRRGSIAYSVLAHTATPVLAYPAGWHPR